jgi:hypothetical protein
LSERHDPSRPSLDGLLECSPRYPVITGKSFGCLLASNEKTFVSDDTGGYARTLVAKNLVLRPNQIYTVIDCVFVVPDFVWAELQRRREEFPRLSDDERPWRMPFGV